MKDYSKIVSEIRRNDDTILKEIGMGSLALAKEKRKEEKRRRQPQMDAIKDKVISYLLEEIKRNQKLGKRVGAFRLENPHDSKIELAIVFTANSSKEDEVKEISYKEAFGAEKFCEIYEAFELQYGKSQAEVLDGFFRVMLEFRCDLQCEEYLRVVINY